jgi:hypothetical protein
MIEFFWAMPLSGYKNGRNGKKRSRKGTWESSVKDFVLGR